MVGEIAVKGCRAECRLGAVEEKVQVLQEKRHAFEWAFGQAACDLDTGLVIMFEDNGIEFGVELFGAVYGLVEKLFCLYLAFGDKFAEPQPVILIVIGKGHEFSPWNHTTYFCPS